MIWVQPDDWLCKSSSQPTVSIQTNTIWGPTNRETIRRILPLIWPLTVFWIFKNSNYEKPWFWWPRQGDDEYSEFDVFKRSRVMNRCAGMSGTWSGVLYMGLEVQNCETITSQCRYNDHMIDFTNRFLDPQWGHGQTLLGSDQSGTDFKKFTVTLSL